MLTLPVVPVGAPLSSVAVWSWVAAPLPPRARRKGRTRDRLAGSENHVRELVKLVCGDVDVPRGSRRGTVVVRCRIDVGLFPELGVAETTTTKGRGELLSPDHVT